MPVATANPLTTSRCDRLVPERHRWRRARSPQGSRPKHRAARTSPCCETSRGNARPRYRPAPRQRALPMPDPTARAALVAEVSLPPARQHRIARARVASPVRRPMRSSQSRSAPTAMRFGPRPSPHPKALGVVLFEDETEARTAQIRCDCTVMRGRRTVEQHVLDPHMVVKPFEMAQPGCGAGDVQMQGRRAMSRKIEMVRRRTTRRPEESR